MSLSGKVTKFCQRNAVMLTVVPLIVGVHWGWYKLQQMPYLVKPEDKKELPIVLVEMFVLFIGFVKYIFAFQAAEKLYEYVKNELRTDDEKSSR